MAKIFISYRREDSQYQADRLHTAIAPHLDDPQRDIFIDIDNIPLGVNFATYLDGKVAECEVLLALIGPGWLEARDEAGNRRLDNPDDFVRIEIASALQRGIPVVPVLLDGAPVPRADQLPDDLKELAMRNGTAIARPSFEADAVRLVQGLGLARPEAIAPVVHASPGLQKSEFNESDYIFISYPKDVDPAFMQAIVRSMIAEGRSVWLFDPVGLGFRVDELKHMRWQQAGSAWEGTTLDALHKAARVLVLISHTSLQARFQAQEIKLAASHAGLVTILIDDLPFESLPEPIAERFARRITPADLETGASEKLLAVLSRDIAMAGYGASVVEPDRRGPVRSDPLPQPTESPRRRTALWAVLAVAGALAGGGALWASGMLTQGTTTQTERVAVTAPPPSEDTTLGSGDLYEAIEAGDRLPLDVVTGESTGSARDGEIAPAPDTSTNDAAARSDAIRDLQRALRDIGLYSSGIDGDVGPGTRAAVSRFASESGARAPDLETATPDDIDAFTAQVEAEAERGAERESAAWALARLTDTIAAYRAYLADYPAGANISSANSRIRALEREAAVQAEAAAWSRAQSTDTLTAYQTYLRDYPSGANASAARSRIAALTPPPEPEYRAGQVFRDPLSGGGQGPEMVVVPAGSFSMGSPAGEAGRQSDEGPQRTVRIGYQFAVGKFEVTWAEWEACVADGGCGGYRPSDQGWGKGNRPVINVNWNDAQAYVEWLSGKTGERYRLLSEAEWEYVARAGTTGRFSNNGGEAELCQIANGADTSTDYSLRNTSCSDGVGKQTAPVGSFRANAFGLYDVHGNVFEWVEDCYMDSYSGAPTDGSARAVSDCSQRVVRGGTWSDNPQYLRSADRSRFSPTSRGNFLGFRVARTF